MDKLLDIIRSLIPNLDNLLSIPIPPGPGPGWLFGTFGTIAVSLYGLSIGKTRTILSLLSIYVAFLITKLFPYFDKVSQIINRPFEDHWLKIIVFIVAYTTVYLIFNFSFIKKRLSSAEFSLLGIMVLSIIQIGFLISIILTFLPEDIGIRWSFGFYNYLGNQQALFLWAIAPLPVLLFLKQK